MKLVFLDIKISVKDFQCTHNCCSMYLNCDLHSKMSLKRTVKSLNLFLPFLYEPYIYIYFHIETFGMPGCTMMDIVRSVGVALGGG